MKVVVYPHTMEIGGSQLNAVDLAGAVRDLGVQVLVFAQPGVLVERVQRLGLEYVEAPPPRRRPSPRVMRALTDLVRRRDVDVVHGYEWTTVLEASWGPGLRLGTAVVGTVMSMAVAPFLPHDVPLVVGTEQIADHERRRGRRRVHVVEPPVDVAVDVRSATAAAAFRQQHGIAPDDFLVVCVTRLAHQLKLEGLLAAVDVAGRSARTDPALRLALVGGGPASALVRERADAVNAAAGRPVVLLTGELRDPAPAYGAADVCLGMGGSALRAMAFGRPLVVQGERGFWELLTPASVDRFLWTGWYGVGDSPAGGPDRLARHLATVRNDPALRADLGGFARRLAEERFALTAAARRQLEIYRSADRPARLSRPGAVAVARFAGHEVTRRVDRVLGRSASDDFNARPVAAVAARSPRPAPAAGEGGSS